MSSLSCLPEEVQVDIFLKLPVNSILRCRCVSKVWCSLLTNPKFIKTHLNHTIQKSKNNPRFIMHTQIEFGRSRIYSLDYGTITSAAASATSQPFVYLEPVIRMDFPFEYNKELSYMEIIGSCNGLVCLSTSYNRDGGESGDTENIICLWNPTTREYANIPLVTPHYFVIKGIRCKVEVGFGYDSNNDDYKVVRISDYNFCGSLRVEVYTLRSNSWTTSEYRNSYMFPTRSPEERGSGFLFKEALHWSGFINNQENCKRVTVSFDVISERLMDFPLPELEFPNSMLERRQLGGIYDKLHISVGALGDRLCFSVTDYYNFRTDLWVMQDYGVRDSWTKLFSTQLIYCSYTRPCLCLDNGEVLMATNVGLVFFDKMNKRCRYMTDKLSNCWFRSELHGYNVDSLVALDSGTYVETKPTNGDTQTEERI